MRLDELDTDPPDLRLRYEELATDLETTAQNLSGRLGVELFVADVGRPSEHVTTPSAAASVGRWRNDLSEIEAAVLAPIAQRLGY